MKKIKLADGSTMSHGMIVRDPMASLKVGSLPPLPPRTVVKSNDLTHPRCGAEKKVQEEFPIAGARIATDMGQGGGMRIVADDGPQAFAGVDRCPLDDEPLQKRVTTDLRQVERHPGMVTKPARDDRLRGTHDPADGDRVLDEASRLGRPGGPKR
jgi:hypothetical protein